jgi:hypothetical protein
MSEDAFEVDIKLNTRILKIFRYLTLTPWYALGEFVDNSIDSYLKNQERLRALHGAEYKLRIDIVFEQAADPKASRILIEDNAAGIDEENAKRAFTPGVPPSDLGGISRFGLGMKSSALWYSRNINITSSALGEDVTRRVFFDVDKVVEEELATLPVEIEPKQKDVHGTRVMLLDLDKGLPATATITKIKSHLASIYREYIKSGEVVITVAGQELEYVSPKFLEAPYWPTAQGPGENLEKIEWCKFVSFKLDESWPEHEKAQGNEPPSISGWVAILAKGDTKAAGISLLWRKKVIFGAGNYEDADSYRPNSIFGGGNTFVSQRVIGQLDLSEVEVTVFKNDFVWLEGQQSELERKLKEAISSPDTPLLQMARNYRVTERGAPIAKAVKSAVRDTGKDLESAFLGVATESPDAIESSSEAPEPVGGEESQRESVTLAIPKSLGENLVFEVKDQPGDNSWLRVVHDEEQGNWRVTLNRAHPFMDSFVHLPGADLNPVLRIAAAIGAAEIRSINAGIGHSSFIRSVINELLRGDLARTGSKKNNALDDGEN